MHSFQDLASTAPNAIELTSGALASSAFGHFLSWVEVSTLSREDLPSGATSVRRADATTFGDRFSQKRSLGGFTAIVPIPSTADVDGAEARVNERHHCWHRLSTAEADVEQDARVCGIDGGKRSVTPSQQVRAATRDESRDLCAEA